jgi:transcriptional regulator with XRE-family HTH domain
MVRTTTLRALRVKRAMSQETLEEVSGVSQTIISKIERKGPSLAVAHAIAIAKALGVTVEDLFAGETPRTISKPRRRALGRTHGGVEGEVSAL